ncbi:MAG: hypothetical protein M1358_09790, partial [Chloroflexi bacterium]|nr:hypothetical protein [Chloroflexota bacterium]
FSSLSFMMPSFEQEIAAHGGKPSYRLRDRRLIPPGKRVDSPPALPPLSATALTSVVELASVVCPPSPL